MQKLRNIAFDAMRLLLIDAPCRLWLHCSSLWWSEQKSLLLSWNSFLRPFFAIGNDMKRAEWKINSCLEMGRRVKWDCGVVAGDQLENIVGNMWKEYEFWKAGKKRRRVRGNNIADLLWKLGSNVKRKNQSFKKQKKLIENFWIRFAERNLMNVTNSHTLYIPQQM